MTKYAYGAPPRAVASMRLEWDEYMHYLYLPVRLPGQAGVRLPDRLGFMAHPLNVACNTEHGIRGSTAWLEDHYIYVTARRGYATPGNPLNRPGWHADGFGSDDVNYIWSDRWPTRFAVGRFVDISDDHVVSAGQFDQQITWSETACERGSIEVSNGKPCVLYRLDPSVIHATPIIDGGGDRSFFKISISRSRYNLRGNSHNYLFDYDWKMWDRSEVRNDPAYAGGDAGPQENGGVGPL